MRNSAGPVSMVFSKVFPSSSSIMKSMETTLSFSIFMFCILSETHSFGKRKGDSVHDFPEGARQRGFRFEPLRFAMP